MVDDGELSFRAKARWKILSRALRNLKNNEPAVDIHSVRRFSTYGLFDVKEVSESIPDGDLWYQYTLQNMLGNNPVKIRLLRNTTDASNLIGFNNTGNICVWPSEEVLSYYCVKHSSIFKDKSVCELGSGMTGLAGMQVAVNSECKNVMLTDGNHVSVSNINHIISENRRYLQGKEAKSSVLRWEDTAVNGRQLGSFDVIICADCLFFLGEQYHLIDTIKILLKKDGVCIIFAPRRSGTLMKFVEKAGHSFVVSMEEEYDEEVWQLHKRCLANEHYSTDLHFPLLVRLFHKGNVA